MKKIIIINREGGIIRQPASPLSNSPVQGIDLQPGIIGALRELCRDTDYRLVLFTRRPYSPEDLIPRLFAGEGITFDTVWSEEEATKTWRDVYLNEIWDKSNSYFIGTFPEDQPLAEDLGINGIWLNEGDQTWTNVVTRLKRDSRKITRTRRTSETDITISLDLNGTGEENIDTGIAFFDLKMDRSQEISLCKHPVLSHSQLRNAAVAIFPHTLDQIFLRAVRTGHINSRLLLNLFVRRIGQHHFGQPDPRRDGISHPQLLNGNTD